MLDQIRIVLVNPSHPGNIGAAARAMKNMGLSHLYLVAPEQFPHSDATVRAAGADALLAKAVIVEDLASAIADCQMVFASSARSRSLSWPLCTPKECAERIAKTQGQSIAIVFGRESSGLTNEELALCHYHLNIPTTENFSSLNLAAAVQVVSYELYLAHIEENPRVEQSDSSPANAEQIAGLFEHLESVLVKINFLDPKQPKLLMQRLQRLFNRAVLEEKEIHILRGILSAVEKQRGIPSPTKASLCTHSQHKLTRRP